MELGELDDWSTEQLGILKEKAIMSFGAVYSWTPAEMSLTGSVIGMPITVFTKQARHSPFKNDVAFIYRHVRLFIYFLGSFTTHEIESISADQLDAIAANSLRHIPPDVFKTFSVEQLSNMSGEQVAAISDEQKSLLSSAQKNVLMKIETATLGYVSGM